jgi:CheY-like chemotaxis protein
MARILVVEDFPPMATVVAKMLRRRGHQVACETSVTGALRLGEGFDYAILDLDLPDGDGVSLAEQLLDEGRIENVVFFTATRDRELLTRATSFGLIVDKAAGLDRLLAAVQRLSDADAASLVAVAGSPAAISVRSSGRSGTRRKIE